MAVHTDSIQTLLRQRRELRDCLAELRNEITALNLKADTIVSKTVTGTFSQDQMNSSGEDMPAGGREEPVLSPQDSSPLVAMPNVQTAAAPVSSVNNAPEGQAQNKSQSGDEVAPEPKRADKRELYPEASANIGETKVKGADQMEPTLPVSNLLIAKEKETAEQEDVEKLIIEKLVGKKQVGEHAPIEMLSKDIMKEFDDIDDESLYYRAKLLSDYFSNHPSPVANEVLNRLDRAIKSMNQVDSLLDTKKDFAELREVYREVSSKSYEKLGINGATLVDSRGGIGLLWGVPLFIAGLVLVLFPLILLLRSLAERMFVADFAVQLSYILTASSGFLWGCVGALSYIAWRVGARAKKGSYRKGSSKDLALRAVLGGVLGVVVFLGIVPFMPLVGVIPDMSIGLVSFFIGILSSILFVTLYRLIASLSRKVK